MTSPLVPGTFRQGEHALSRAAALVAEARFDLDAIGAGVRADAERLQVHWSGRGATAFAALAIAWQERQARIVGALDDFESGLRGAERVAESADEEQNAGLLALQHALGAVPGR
ncbi:hypothetical protein GCM10022215_27350 [Nocardioides fonticola]|uniref:WXG100 family type VII secretion target n=1 Tax=Nocardioides fonticola TaxID=450363 RepID=A0ABP7XN56_9ACTN